MIPRKAKCEAKTGLVCDRRREMGGEHFLLGNRENLVGAFLETA